MYTLAEFINMFSALVIVLGLGIIFRITLKNKSFAIRQIPIHVVGATILILEVVKQTYHIIHGDWHAWFLPLHFCSFFLVWYAVALFTRGKVRQLMYFCSLTGGILVSILLFAAPSMILHDASRDIWSCFDHVHTYFYHIGMFAYWVWLLMLDIYQPEREHIKKTILVYTSFYFVVLAGAYIFHENFTDALYSSVNAFNTARLKIGQFLYDTILIGVGIGAITGISFLTYHLLNKVRQHKNVVVKD